MRNFKFISIIAIFAMLGIQSFAAGEFTKSAYNASGSTTQSIILPDTSTTPGSGNRISIDSITAMGDVATAVVQIQKADTTGVTDNFTIVSSWDLGDATKTYPENGSRIAFIGEPNTMYKVTIAATTTTNSLTVTGRQVSIHEKL